MDGYRRQRDSVSVGDMSQPDIPNEFAEQVRAALGHLLDAVRLQHEPLALYLVPSAVTDPQARAHRLREAVLEAIDAPRPPAGVSPRDPAYRPYAILRQKYAEGFPAEEVQRRLSISRRQFFREQTLAFDALAELLWERRLASEAPQYLGSQSLSSDLEEVGISNQNFVLAETTRQALAAIAPLVAAQAASVEAHASEATLAYADEAVARQIIVGLLSSLLQQAACRQIGLDLGADEQWAWVDIKGCEGAIELPSVMQRLASASAMADEIGARLDVGSGLLRLRLPLGRQEVVAIVDDNVKTLQLFKRYLEAYRYRLALIPVSSEAVDRIREAQPDVVILDVMMRDVDGWQVLQALRASPETRDLPVVICSVLDEESLAYAIGADAYLRKPVTQSALVQTLAELRQPPYRP
jgi:CheY-like chemotaxis protein